MFRELKYIVWKWRIHRRYEKRRRAHANESFHFTERKDSSTHAARKRRSYLRERTEQREYLNSQIARLDKLLEDNSIDEDTYTRSKTLLKMNYEQKREATREKHGFTNSMTLTQSNALKCASALLSDKKSGRE